MNRSSTRTAALAIFTLLAAACGGGAGEGTTDTAGPGVGDSHVTDDTDNAHTLVDRISSGHESPDPRLVDDECAAVDYCIWRRGDN